MKVNSKMVLLRRPDAALGSSSGRLVFVVLVERPVALAMRLLRFTIFARLSSCRSLVDADIYRLHRGKVNIS